MARSSLLEVIREDFVRTGPRGQRLNGRLVMTLHALPNALPVITLSGIRPDLSSRFDPGRASLRHARPRLVDVHRGVERDIFVMQNLVFLYAVVFVVLNIVVDLVIAWLDPRIHYQWSMLPHLVSSSASPAPVPLCCEIPPKASAATPKRTASWRFARRSPPVGILGIVDDPIIGVAIAAPLIATIRAAEAPISGT